jgi:hypothetical protein
MVVFLGNGFTLNFFIGHVLTIHTTPEEQAKDTLDTPFLTEEGCGEGTSV